MWKFLAASLLAPLSVVASQVGTVSDPLDGPADASPDEAAGLASAAPRAAAKLDKDGLVVAPLTTLRSKDKRCCGYPLVPELGFALRFYWLAFEEEYDDPEERNFAHADEVEIYTRDGLYIGAIPERFAWSLHMEGSGLMADGRVINYSGPCKYGYGVCFETLDRGVHPYGRGAGKRPLIPFKSVAVDQRLVKIGDPLYIPEFDGLPLPDGTVHDGCVRADDTGGGIKKRKMDFFVVTYRNFRFLLDELWGVSFITPHVNAPKCEYLREL